MILLSICQCFCGPDSSSCWVFSSVNLQCVLSDNRMSRYACIEMICGIFAEGYPGSVISWGNLGHLWDMDTVILCMFVSGVLHLHEDIHSIIRI